MENEKLSDQKSECFFPREVRELGFFMFNPSGEDEWLRWASGIVQTKSIRKSNPRTSNKYPINEPITT